MGGRAAIVPQIVSEVAFIGGFHSSGPRPGAQPAENGSAWLSWKQRSVALNMQDSSCLPGLAIVPKLEQPSLLGQERVEMFLRRSCP